MRRQQEQHRNQLQLQLRQQQLRLQQLHLEKQHQLTKEKELELTRRAQMLRNGPISEIGVNGSPQGGIMLDAGHGVNAQAAMTTPGVDPFLGQGLENAAFFKPQNANDSGIVMNSSFTFSSPSSSAGGAARGMGGVNARNTDQFLNSIDGMETSDPIAPMMMISPDHLTEADIDAGPVAFMDGDELVNTISELQSEDNLLPDIDMDAVLPSVLGGGADDPNLTWL